MTFSEIIADKRERGEDVTRFYVALSEASGIPAATLQTTASCNKLNFENSRRLIGGLKKLGVIAADMVMDEAIAEVLPNNILSKQDARKVVKLANQARRAGKASQMRSLFNKTYKEAQKILKTK